MPVFPENRKSNLVVCFAISPSAHQLNSEGELAKHGHAIHFYNDDWNSSDGNGGKYNQPGIVHDSMDRSAKNTNRWADLVESTGGNQPHNNLPPLYGVYKFRRIS